MHVSGKHCDILRESLGAAPSTVRSHLLTPYDVNLLRFSLSGRPPPVCRLPGEQVRQDSRGQTGWPASPFLMEAFLIRQGKQQGGLTADLRLPAPHRTQLAPEVSLTVQVCVHACVSASDM